MKTMLVRAILIAAAIAVPSSAFGAAVSDTPAPGAPPAGAAAFTSGHQGPPPVIVAGAAARGRQTGSVPAGAKGGK